MKVLSLAIAAALGLAPSAQAAIYTLDFSGDICTVGPCTNGATISQEYGDTALVDVSHDYTLPVPHEPGLAYWGNGYSDLANVGWGGDFNPDNLGGIKFAPTSGYKVNLLSFDIGTWGSDATASITIHDGVGGLLADLGAQSILFSGASTFDTGWTSDDGIEIRWANAYQFGIGNITFEVTEGGVTPPPPAVPLPASALLLLTGLGGLGLAARRRRGAA